MPYSNCCGAFTDMEEYGICPDCKEHCDFFNDEDEDEEDEIIDEPEEILVECEWCKIELDLAKTDWCNNCDTSVFDNKCNNKPEDWLINKNKVI
jgi:hypothetical protein